MPTTPDVIHWRLSALLLGSGLRNWLHDVERIKDTENTIRSIESLMGPGMRQGRALGSNDEFMRNLENVSK